MPRPRAGSLLERAFRILQGALVECRREWDVVRVLGSARDAQSSFLISRCDGVVRVGLLIAWALLVSFGAVPASRAAERGRVFTQLPAGFPGVAEGETPWVVANQLIVRVRPEVRRQLQGGHEAWGGTLRWLAPASRVGLAGRVAPGVDDLAVAHELAVLTLPFGVDLRHAVEDLQRQPGVQYVEPNLRLQLAVEEGAGPRRTGGAGREPSDFEFRRQWGLNNTGQTGGVPGADIRALEAWAVTVGSSNVVVAIIDTGIDYFHPDLEANIWVNPGEIPGNGLDDDGNGRVDDVHGFDFVSDDGDPLDDNVHGTHVAGILGAVGNNETGVVGVAWSVRLMALKAFDESGGGTLDDTLAAVAYATSEGARIINASWGTTTRSRALDEVVAAAVNHGTIFVAAAGNNGNDLGFYPAAVPQVIAVGATDAQDRSANFSNFGRYVDVMAPGDSIYSTTPDASWGTLSGTSMAAPHVSGLVALMLARRPEFTPAEVISILRSTADELTGVRFSGAGRVNAARAVRVEEPLPSARLNLPAVVSGRVDVLGTAAGNGFAGFRLELGAGERPKQWTVLGEGAGLIDDGVLLAGWETARLDDGDYTVRLSVSNRVGQAAIERASVSVRNVQFSAPLNNDVLRRGDRFLVPGTVFGEGRAFTVSWGNGRDPAAWRTDGIEVPSGGRAPVVNGVLATWDTSVVAADGFVSLRLEAREGDRVVGTALAQLLFLEGRLRPGWPIYLPFSDEFPAANWREFNVDDLEGDGPQEIILVDHGEPGGRPPRLMVLRADGQPKWIRDLPAGAPEHDAPVVGDVDGDGRAEIFVDTGEGGAISAFDAAGAPLPGWPVTPGGNHFGKILADLDGDGRRELIALSNPPKELGGTQQRRLTVIGADGVVRRQWVLGGCAEEANVPELLPAVGNLDADAALEIVAANGCLGVSVFDLDEPAGPRWTAMTEANLFAPPVVGDLDGDGTEEVVVAGARRGEGMPGGLYVFDRQGNPRRGWPVLTEESFQGGVALADLDGDGRLEMVVASWDSERVHVVGVDGFEMPGWPTLPLRVSAARSVPVVGDVDGDGWPDVVLASPGFWLPLTLANDTARAGGVRAWRGDGTEIDFHPTLPPSGLVMEASGSGDTLRLPPVALADLDGNGQLDLVAASIQDRAYSVDAPHSRVKQRSSLYAWELPVATLTNASSWPAYQGGPQRTGRYLRPAAPNQPPRLRDVPSQTVAVGESFRPLALDRYADDPDGRVERLVWTVTGARELRVLVDAQRVLRVEPPSATWEGSEELRLTVRDPAGAEASATLVFSARPGYRPPRAITDTIETREEEAVELDPTLNDVSPAARRLRVIGVSRPGFGSTQAVGPSRVRYVPAPDFFGTDSFEYQLADDDGGFAIGEVQVRVVPQPDPPVPEPDRIILPEDATAELDFLANDVDVDAEPLHLVSVEKPEAGELEPLGGGRFLFVPPTNYFGVQKFSYVVGDPGGLISTGEVSILVKPVNDAPVFRDQVVTLNRNRSADVFYDVEDADGDTLTYTIVEPPAQGSLLTYPTIANYQPAKDFAGTDRFQYLVSDGQSTVGPATVTLRVTNTNNPPTVDPIVSVTAVDQELELPLIAHDADADPITFGIREFPQHGSLALAGTNAIYTPAPGFLGTDTFTFVAGDGIALSEPATASVRVTADNTAPVPVSEILNVRRNQSTPITLRATDPENNPMRFLVVTNPALGRLEGTAPRLIYTPVTNYLGIDRLYFQVADRFLTSEVVVVHLWVREPNVVPVATNQNLTVVRDTPTPFQLRAIDSDGNPLRAAILKGPTAGRLFGLGVDYTYVPRAGFLGLDTFTYKVWDGYGYSAPAKVSVTVQDRVPLTLEIVGARLSTEGFELIARSEPGLELEFETAGEWGDWIVAARLANPTGTLRWVDSEVRTGSARFYRVRTVMNGANP